MTAAAATPGADEPPGSLQELGDPRDAALVDVHGRSYRQFRAGLRPRWARVAADMLLGYLALALIGWTAVAATGAALPWSLALTLLCAIAFGYWMAYLQLFLHEAAHFNIAASRRYNELLANLLIASWVGTSIGAYRAVHWQHHRRHGQTDDAEHSYFAPLNGRFVLAALTGVSALRVLRERRAQLRTRGARAAPAAGRILLAIALLLHGTLLAVALLTAHPWLALAWLLGIGVFFPFFGAVRQLLEHRSVRARADVDYAATPHGATTRMFQEGLLGSSFGAAGFTRHRLHHWDPALSYTNLAAVERFLRGCPGLGPRALHKTTYWRAWRALYGRP
jgi:fatty acid desaturase